VCSIDVAAVRTVAAGHDLVLSCHDHDSQRKVFKGLLDAYRGKFLPNHELEESAERIKKLKNKRPQRFTGIVGPDPQGETIAKSIAEKAVHIIQDKEKILPLSAELSQDVGIIFPQLSSFAPKIMIEKEFEDEIAFFEHALADYPGLHVTEIYKIDPDAEDIENASNLAHRTAVTLYFCFDAHLYPTQQKLFAALHLAARKLIVILMRDPYDKSFLRPKDTGLTAFGFRKYQIKAALARIYGEG